MAHQLTGSARRFLAERLDRLQQTLETFCQRVREGVAAVIGGHIGDAVRDALHAALRIPHECRRDPLDPPLDDRFDSPDGKNYEVPYEEPTAYWRVPEPIRPPMGPPEPRPPSRWRTLLTGGLHAAGWWLHQRLTQRPRQATLGLAAVAGVVAVAWLAGPFAASLLALGGAAVWLRGWSCSLRRVADRPTSSSMS